MAISEDDKLTDEDYIIVPKTEPVNVNDEDYVNSLVGEYPACDFILPLGAGPTESHIGVGKTSSFTEFILPAGLADSHIDEDASSFRKEFETEPCTSGTLLDGVRIKIEPQNENIENDNESPVAVEYDQNMEDSRGMEDDEDEEDDWNVDSVNEFNMNYLSSEKDSSDDDDDDGHVDDEDYARSRYIIMLTA
jgi:hypothetical protein